MLNTLAPQRVNILCLLAVERMLAAQPSSALQQILTQAFERARRHTYHDMDSLKTQALSLVAGYQPQDIDAHQAQCAALALLFTLEYMDSQQVEYAEQTLAKQQELFDLYSEQGQPQAVSADLDWQQQLAAALSVEELDDQQLMNLRRHNQQHGLPPLQTQPAPI
ncbi:hypothetical protein [Idiomarina xiamenensis]|uniref:Uncharacterized protein n=1 Tax=Idiomarina xiamenensis 10-D-4 TaxID=740709 RepID=K2JLP0_9GAMM|nr:hypothetical protein [Idiomarina xiamenensis]EKE84416.1 hypothetical protein A10D4_05092 [Idiomarina xiamenensis 10-D-4]